MEWTRTTTNGFAHYAGQIGRYAGTKATATVYRVGKHWTGIANVEGKEYAAEVFGRFRTATEARAAIGGLCAAQIAHNAKAAVESGFADDKEAGAKVGAAHFAHVDSYDRASTAARSLRAEVRNGTAGYRAARVHCGVYAPSKRRAAFAEAFRYSFYAAMQAAMDSRLIRTAALDIVQTGSTLESEMERLGREWSLGYAATLGERIAAEVARLRAAEVARLRASQESGQ